MSIATAIQAAQQKVADAYTAASAKGATLPASQNLSNLATTIAAIPTGTTPTGSISITSNGTYDVTNYANADVQVPTTAPAHYIEKTVNANGVLQDSTNIINLNGVTDVGDYVLAADYRGAAFPTGTALSLPLIAISGDHACFHMFAFCSGITSVDMSALTTISGGYACRGMFQDCTELTSVNLSALTTLSGTFACDNMFADCTGLTSVDFLSSLTTISGQCACQLMFAFCSGLTSANLSSLTTISGDSAFGSMFNTCTSLTTVYIGGTTAIDFGTTTNPFNYMFYNCTQNIDVYAPAANQAQIEAMSQYPSFGCTGTVTWHWRS